MGNNANQIVKKTYTNPKTGKFVLGNPGGGRPAGTLSIVTEIKKKLQKIPKGEKKSYIDKLVSNLVTDAITGADPQARKLIMNYVEGMPKQQIKYSGELIEKTELNDEQLEQLIQRTRKKLDSGEIVKEESN